MVIVYSSSRCGPFDKVIEGLKTVRIKVDILITKEYNLEGVGESFNYLEENKDHIKTVIHI